MNNRESKIKANKQNFLDFKPASSLIISLIYDIYLYYALAVFLHNFSQTWASISGEDTQSLKINLLDLLIKSSIVHRHSLFLDNTIYHNTKSEGKRRQSESFIMQI